MVDKKNSKSEQSDSKITIQVKEGKKKLTTFTNKLKQKINKDKTISSDLKPRIESKEDLSKMVVDDLIDKKGNYLFESTADVKISKNSIDHVIGQDEAVTVIKKAALQRRHVLLLGEPGTGKSMLGKALADLLPKEQLVDILSFPNPDDENEPIIKTVKSGEGKKIVSTIKSQTKSASKGQGIFLGIMALISLILPWWIRAKYQSDIMFAAFFLGGLGFLLGFLLVINLGKKMVSKVISSPKLIVDTSKKEKVPFIDATGAHAGALLGDVLHDPFQSGGLGTPAHERVVSGMIHKANMGVLFIDEIATMDIVTQQELLTAIQEGKFSITGQSEKSAGAMVRTEPVPCKFVLVAAGNLDILDKMHPALRSRIIGNGYEVFMNDTMKDTLKNRSLLVQFMAQEVEKDGKIPHLDPSAVDEIIFEARKRSNRKGHLTLRLRELSGLIKVSGDLALEEKSKLVTSKHVLKAKTIARSIEKQLMDKHITRKKDYEVIITKGTKIGRVNGLSVIGNGSNMSGSVLPIEAQVVLGGKSEKVIATGKLQEIAKESIINVSAIIKKYFGTDLKDKYDIYVQFLQTYEGLEGDSASIAVATIIISALKNIPIKQTHAITGSLSIRGEVLPIGGVSAKIEGAIEAGIKTVVIPKSNLQDVVLDDESLKKIKIIPVSTLSEALKEMMDWKGKSKIWKQIEKATNS